MMRCADLASVLDRTPAKITLRRALAPGHWVLGVAGEAAVWRITLHFGNGSVALPLLPPAQPFAIRFRLKRPTEAITVQAEEVGATATDCRFTAIAPWRHLANDIDLGDVTLPGLMDGSAGGVLGPMKTPTGWQGLTIEEADGVDASGSVFRVRTAGGALSVRLPSAAAGPLLWRAKVDACGPVAPSLVTGRSVVRLLPVGADHCALTRGGGDTVVRFRPRLYPGEVAIPSFSVSRVSSAFAALFAVRYAKAASAATVPGPVWGWAQRFMRPLPGRPAPPLPALTGRAFGVSIVTATRDAPRLLRPFLESLARTDSAYELILVDNGTTDPAARELLKHAASHGHTVLSDPRPFNYPALNNRGVAAANGEVIVLANNDIRFHDPSWLTPLANAAADPGVGCAGARLLYPGGGVQHAGIVMAGEFGPRHLERYLPPSAPGYARRQRRLTQVSAVSGALLAIRTELYRALGGLDPALPVRFNDIDLCLKADAAGFANVYVPQSVAIHAESASLALFRRRSDPVRDAHRLVERALFHTRWSDRLARDPYYPPQFDPRRATFSRPPRFW